MRPDTHWRGFWAPWLVIFTSLLAKVAGRKWPAELSRQRQQYWWRGYQLQSRIRGAPQGLWQLLLSRQILATHSLVHREIQAVRWQTHRIFAVTSPSGGP
jgi:hypothetical protein